MAKGRLRVKNPNQVVLETLRSHAKLLLSRSDRNKVKHVLLCVAEGDAREARVLDVMSDGHIGVISNMFYNGVLAEAEEDPYRFVLQNFLSLYVDRFVDPESRGEESTPQQSVDNLEDFIRKFLPRNLVGDKVTVSVEGVDSVTIDMTEPVEDNVNEAEADGAV